jgi:PAS domain-containing protein
MAMKLHRDILNFESEALVNWEILKTIINNSNVIESQNNNRDRYQSLFQEVSAIIVRCRSESFMDISYVSDAFAKLIGTKKQILIDSNLNMLLPNIINEAHDSLVRTYLTSKKTDPSNSLKKQ